MAIRELQNFRQFASTSGMGSSQSRFSNFDLTNFALETGGLGVFGDNTIRMQEAVGDFYHSMTANLSGNRHMHAAFYLHTPGTLASAEWLRFSNGTTDQCRFYVDASGVISVSAWEPSGWSAIASTAAGAFDPSTIHHVEVHYDKDNSGAINIWIDGVQVMAFTGDTYNGSALTWGRTYFGWLGGNTKLDSVALWDVAADANQSDFAASHLGEHRIEYLIPDGAGTYSTWTPNTGGAPAAVDDMPNDGDTTYIDDTGLANGSKHSFTVGALSWNPATVHAVGVYAVQRRTSSGSLPVIRLLARTGTDEEAVTHDGTVSTAFSPARVAFSDINGAALNVSSINAMEVGIEVSTWQSGSRMRLTSIFAQVLASAAEPASEEPSEPPSEPPSDPGSEPPSEPPSEPASEPLSEPASEEPSEPVSEEPLPPPPPVPDESPPPIQVVITG
jgi:hypothetical protein